MTLIPRDFGARPDDPYTPPHALISITDDPETQQTVATWESNLPWDTDDPDPDLHTPADRRMALTVAVVADVCHVHEPWTIALRSLPQCLRLVITLDGPLEWPGAITPLQQQEFETVAEAITLTTWAAWHATGQCSTQHAVEGVLWLTAAGCGWQYSTAIAEMVGASGPGQ